MTHETNAQPLPETLKAELAGEVGGIVRALAAYSFTPAQVTDLLAGVVEGALQDQDAVAVTPVARFDASVQVAAAADTLTHVYAQAAIRAGYTWADLAAAARLGSAQAAHWRWGRNAQDTGGFDSDAGALPASVQGLMPSTREPVSVREAGWVTASELGRKIHRDPRTVREMAARGEVEVLHREPGRDGRTRDLYRDLQPARR